MRPAGRTERRQTNLFITTSLSTPYFLPPPPPPPPSCRTGLRVGTTKFPLYALSTSTNSTNEVAHLSSPTEWFRAAPIGSEQPRAAPSSSEQPRADPSSPEQLRADPSSPEQTRAAPSSPEQHRAAPSSPEQLRAAPSSSEQLRAAHNRLLCGNEMFYLGADPRVIGHVHLMGVGGGGGLTTQEDASLRGGVTVVLKGCPLSCRQSS